jgi:hypothetical protein
MSRQSICALATLVFSLFAISAASVAQQPAGDRSQQPGMGMMGPDGMMSQGMMGPGMRGMMGPYGMMGQGMMGPGMMMGFGPMMAGQLAYLKAELKITDAQKEAWDAYVSAVEARATTMQGMHTATMQAMHAGNALERLDAHIRAMQSMLESMQAIKPVTVALYNVLSDDQKKKADELLGNGCCMM